MNAIEATLCYVEENNKILMLHRISRHYDFHYGKYNGLGGKFETGESPRDCVLREVYEESGLRPARLRFIGHITFPAFDGKNDWSVFIYRAFEPQGTLLDHTPEGKLEWVPKDNLLDLPLWEGDRIFLPWVMQDKKFMARFDYRNGKYMSHDVQFIMNDVV